MRQACALLGRQPHLDHYGRSKGRRMRILQNAIKSLAVFRAGNMSSDGNVRKQDVVVAVANKMDIFESWVGLKLRSHLVNVAPSKPDVGPLQYGEAHTMAKTCNQQCHNDAKNAAAKS